MRLGAAGNDIMANVLSFVPGTGTEMEAEVAKTHPKMFPQSTVIIEDDFQQEMDRLSRFYGRAVCHNGPPYLNLNQHTFAEWCGAYERMSTISKKTGDAAKKIAELERNGWT